jgi:DNA-binding NtrC family response regulator
MADREQRDSLIEIKEVTMMSQPLPSLPPRPRAPWRPQLAGAVPLRSLQLVQQSLATLFLTGRLTGSRQDLKDFLGKLEADIICGALGLTMGSQKEAAYLMGIKPTALHEKMKRFGLIQSDPGNTEGGHHEPLDR